MRRTRPQPRIWPSRFCRDEKQGAGVRSQETGVRRLGREAGGERRERRTAELGDLVTGEQEDGRKRRTTEHPPRARAQPPRPAPAVAKAMAGRHHPPPPRPNTSGLAPAEGLPPAPSLEGGGTTNSKKAATNGTGGSPALLTTTAVGAGRIGLRRDRLESLSYGTTTTSRSGDRSHNQRMEDWTGRV